MIRTGALRVSVLAVMLAGTLPSIPAAAQDAKAVPPSRNTLRVECCRCIDGRVQTLNLNTGSAPWQVQPPSGGPAVAPILAPNPPSSWTSLPPAKWVRHPVGSPVGNYVYTLTIWVPKCQLQPTVTLAGAFAADNQATLQVNANPSVSTVNTTGFVAPTAIPATPLQPGMNTITVRLTNLHGVTGFLFRGAVTSRCPREVVEATSNLLDDR